MSGEPGAERLELVLRQAAESGRLALVPFLTAGFPRREGFVDLLRKVSEIADVVELGVPWSDPMADGVTIQRSSHAALTEGVTLEWILDTVGAMTPRPVAPLVLMSYLNPLMAFGFRRLAQAMVQAGVDGLIVPDLPLEESVCLAGALERDGLALVHLVSPVTPPERLARLCQASRGFVYAVTVTGTTGGSTAKSVERDRYLDRVRAASGIPVLAGFGVRTARDVHTLAGRVDGVIVGSALIEVLERGEDPIAFLRGLRSDHSLIQGSAR